MPSSSSSFISRLVTAISNKSANFSIPFGVSFCIGLKFSNSSMWKRIFHHCPPYFLSRRSFTAWYAYPECRSPSIDFRASPKIYWCNCKSLYSAVPGAPSMQTVNADFQFLYCSLSRSKMGIKTLLSFLQRSFPILSLSFSINIFLPCYWSLILPISPGTSVLSILAVLLVSLLTSLDCLVLLFPSLTFVFNISSPLYISSLILSSPFFNLHSFFPINLP